MLTLHDASKNSYLLCVSYCFVSLFGDLPHICILSGVPCSRVLAVVVS